MAKNNSPAFLFYSADFLVGCTLLSMEERGKYITLICMQHQLGHLSKEDMESIVGSISNKLLSKFDIDDNGLYYNKRAEEEMLKRKAYSESRSNNRKNTSKSSDKTQDNHMMDICGTYEKHMENENDTINNNSIIEDVSWFLDKYNIQVDSYNGELSSYDFKKLDEYMQKSSWLRDYIKCTSTLCKLYHKIMTGQYNDMKFKKAENEEMDDREYLVKVGKFSQEYVDELTDDEAKEKENKWKKLFGGNI